MNWLKRVLKFVSTPYPPPATLLPEEMNGVLAYHDRLNRCAPPEPESEARLNGVRPAKDILFRETYSGKNASFYVDTQAGVIQPLAFSEKSGDETKRFELDIKPTPSIK